MNASYNANNLTNNNISEIQGLSVSIGPSVGGSNSTSKNPSFIGSRVSHHFKIILLGDVYVGKTCVITRYCENKINDYYKCTLLIDWKTKRYNPDQMNTIDLAIYDTCGEEKFRALTRSYYRYAQGAILLFDLTSESSFLSLDQWLNDLKGNGSKEIEIIIAGNKSDLQNKRCIDYSKAEQFAKERNLSYFEISAFTGFNVELLFETLANKLVKTEQLKSEKERMKIQQETFYKQQVMKQKLKKQEKKNGRDEGCC